MRTIAKDQADFLSRFALPIVAYFYQQYIQHAISKLVSFELRSRIQRAHSGTDKKN